MQPANENPSLSWRDDEWREFLNEKKNDENYTNLDLINPKKRKNESVSF